MLCKANASSGLALELLCNGLGILDPAVAQAQMDGPKAASALYPQWVLSAGGQLGKKMQDCFSVKAWAKLMRRMQLLQDSCCLSNSKMAKR